jgi:hypothetical protein
MRDLEALNNRIRTEATIPRMDGLHVSSRRFDCLGWSRPHLACAQAKAKQRLRYHPG